MTFDEIVEKITPIREERLEVIELSGRDMNPNNDEKNCDYCYFFSNIKKMCQFGSVIDEVCEPDINDLRHENDFWTPSDEWLEKF